MFFIVLTVMVSLAVCALAAYAVRDTISNDGRRTGKLVLGIAGLYGCRTVHAPRVTGQLVTGD
jgi:hypothetical protein